MRLLERLLDHLRCPDDGAPLHFRGDALECQACARQFPYEDNSVSLLSSDAVELDGAAHYQAGYLQARSERDSDQSLTPGWSLPVEASPRLMAYRQRQVAHVLDLLEQDPAPPAVICDFSAGPGYYTLACARRGHTVMHCDLALDSLRQAHAEARRQGLSNILFVRMDYLRPPFRSSLPAVVCLDTLIRGQAHERALLAAISASLQVGGCAIVDFHNWWHNPLRRLGLLKDNFTFNRSYSRHEVEALLAASGIQRYERHPFRQEFDPHSPFAAHLGRLIPPTRWMYRFRHDAEPHSGRS